MSNGFDLVCQTGFNLLLLAWAIPSGRILRLLVAVNGTEDINALPLPNTSVGRAPRGPVGAGGGTTWCSLSEASLITVALSNGATERGETVCRIRRFFSGGEPEKPYFWG